MYIESLPSLYWWLFSSRLGPGGNNSQAPYPRYNSEFETFKHEKNRMFFSLLGNYHMTFGQLETALMKSDYYNCMIVKIHLWSIKAPTV